MSEFQLNLNNRDDAEDWLISLQNESPFWILDAKIPNIGKWSMSRLFHSWCKSSGDWMAQNGSRMPMYIDRDGKSHGERLFNEGDAKELFSSTWYADENGKRLSWSKGGTKTARAGTRGERYYCCDRLQQWMLERGIKHLNPNDSDFKRAQQEQDD